MAVRHGSAAGTPPVELQFLVGDAQGSAQVAVDAVLGSNGAVDDADASTTWSSSAYGPYGTTRDSDNLTITRGWLGQVEDTSTPDGGAGTGLTYLNARYYDPVIGRFLSPDPLMDPGDPRTLDPYRYADNNPIVFMDPTGLWPEWSSLGDDYMAFRGAQSQALVDMGGAVVHQFSRTGINEFATHGREVQRQYGYYLPLAGIHVVVVEPARGIWDSTWEAGRAAIRQDAAGLGYHGTIAGTQATLAAAAVPGAALGVRAVSAAAARIKPAMSSWFSRASRQPAAVGSEASLATGQWFPRRPLPRDESGIPIPESQYAHTQLGRRDGRSGPYPQAREFGDDGVLVRDIDFTDHGRPGLHSNPHEHRWLANPTGGSPIRGSARIFR